MSYDSRELTPLHRLIVTFPKEELTAFENREPARPLAVDPYDDWRYKGPSRLSPGDLELLRAALRSKADDGVHGGASYDVVSSDSVPCTKSELITADVVDGSEVSSLHGSTSAEEVPPVVLLALALLRDINTQSSLESTTDDPAVLGETVIPPSTPAIPPSSTLTSPLSTLAALPPSAPSTPPPSTPSTASPHILAAAPSPPTLGDLDQSVLAAPHPPTHIKAAQFVRRSCRVGPRPATYAETLPYASSSPVTAKAITRAKGKVTAKGKTRPSKAPTTRTTRPPKATGKKPHARRDATLESDEENIPVVHQSTGRRPPKRRSSDSDDDEYVEHPPTKRQKVLEPATAPVDVKTKQQRDPRINQKIVDGLLDRDVRGPCPWVGCDYELRGAKCRPLVEHFATHVVDKAVFKSRKDSIRCPACSEMIQGYIFAKHVIEKHLGAQWRCLLWNDKDAPCDWKGCKGDRIAQHCRITGDPLHLRALEDARKI